MLQLLDEAGVRRVGDPLPGRLVHPRQRRVQRRGLVERRGGRDRHVVAIGREGPGLAVQAGGQRVLVGERDVEDADRDALGALEFVAVLDHEIADHLLAGRAATAVVHLDVERDAVLDDGPFHRGGESEKGRAEQEDKKGAPDGGKNPIKRSGAARAGE